MNCWVAPALTLGEAGETPMDVTVATGEVTVSVVDPVTPLSVAVIVVLPALAPAAKPEALTIATDCFDEAQVTEDERSAVDPSL
ncbi:MAG TPA: hypothetical protein VMT38_00365 [Terracidiphilus sp.]|nr:hypothetical protein [Terracidiphilus sp.]